MLSISLVFFPCPVLWDQPLKLLVDIHVVDETQQTPTIDHFTVIGLMACPLNGSEAGADLVLIQTSLLLLWKSSCSYAN